MTRSVQATWILPIILACASLGLASLDVTYQWKYVDYLWPDEDAKAAAVEVGNYDLTKIIINDVQPLSDGRVIVTTPKYFDNPASLSTISEESGDGGPLLAPYPDWSWHAEGAHLQIISVSRVILDDYDRLWLVDSGKTGNEKICAPKILVFDTITDKLLFEFGIPDHLAHSPDNEEQGKLEILEVETHDDLTNKTWVYISDLEGFGVLITDLSKIWRRDDDVFKPNPNETEFTIAGENVTLNIGSSGAFAPTGYLDKPTLLFKPLSSAKAHAVSIHDLHNSHSSTHDVKFWTSNFTEPGQETARTFTSDGILLAAFPTQSAIACWNAENPLLTNYIGFLDLNATIYQYVSSAKYLDEIAYVTSNRLHKFLLRTMDFDEINYRVMTGNIPNLVKGTVCESTGTWNVTGISEKAFHPYDGTS